MRDDDILEYIATEDVKGYPECPPIGWKEGDDLSIPVKKGTKIRLTYYDECSMQFLTEDGKDVVFNRDWSDSPPCDYKKYFNLPVGIKPLKSINN